jgi:hypothetical protein
MTHRGSWKLPGVGVTMVASFATTTTRFLASFSGRTFFTRRRFPSTPTGWADAMHGSTRMTQTATTTTR